MSDEQVDPLDEGLEPFEVGPATAGDETPYLDEGLIGFPVESEDRGADPDDLERR
jgi:hypothetical protein